MLEKNFGALELLHGGFCCQNVLTTQCKKMENVMIHLIFRKNGGELPRIAADGKMSLRSSTWSVASRVSSQPKRNNLRVLLMLMGAVASLTITSSPALAADSSACNNINVSAEANCSAVVEADCMTQCTPTSVILACDGQCSGTCEETATTECNESCSSWCNTECETAPGSFNCQAGCSTNCETACPGKCHDHPDNGKCEASCRTTCGTECTASCTVVLPTATCETKCGTCCDTSCTVQRNVECEVGCDIDCNASVQGGCKTRCEDPQGAIFCDGQYVDAGNNLQECVDYLKSIEINVDVEAWGSVSAEAEGGLSCEAMPGKFGGLGATAALAGLGLLAFVVFRRRSRK